VRGRGRKRVRVGVAVAVSFGCTTFLVSAREYTVCVHMSGRNQKQRCAQNQPLKDAAILSLPTFILPRSLQPLTVHTRSDLHTLQRTPSLSHTFLSRLPAGAQKKRKSGRGSTCVVRYGRNAGATTSPSRLSSSGRRWSSREKRRSRQLCATCDMLWDSVLRC
jgi:hypothetical protein